MDTNIIANAAVLFYRSRQRNIKDLPGQAARNATAMTNPAYVYRDTDTAIEDPPISSSQPRLKNGDGGLYEEVEQHQVDSVGLAGKVLRDNPFKCLLFVEGNSK